MTTIPLASRLVGLLQGHGVEAELRDDCVYLPRMGRWANLWMWQTDSGTWLTELRATGVGDEVVTDRWAALGDDVDRVVRDGLTSFCMCGFHVLLAALWGVLETDQVDHEERRSDGQVWDVYLGPYTTRVSAGTAPLVAPAGLVDRVLSALDESLRSGKTHLLRVYVATVNGAVTVEALVDDAPSDVAHHAVSSAGWRFPETGFASLRWVVVARRREGTPAHLETRTCTQPVT